MKDYAGAVAAYEDALEYEPDNAVTKTYLDKARQKLEKHQQRQKAGEELSVADTMMTPSMSVVTDAVMESPDPNDQHHQHRKKSQNAVLTGAYQGRNRNAMMHAAGVVDEYDPDFDEALKIQQRANAFLQQKHYKSAIEEYTAALFLCPDDPHLSPDLHLGRAHALNGSRRHESAKNDALLAIKLTPSPAAYSTLAKSLFYLQNYKGAIEAFRDCANMLPPGDELGMFDQAYLEKAEAALEEEEASLRAAGSPLRHHHDAKSPIPKLPPPRFVPREQAIMETPNLPPMPKQWPQQSPHSPTALKCGPERKVTCLSEALGIKLNRGHDGIVRVLSVTPDTPKSPISRQGTIHQGDVLREAAGVDLRRPITNIMWGDTVALIKMAPRPITLIVAQEMSPVPPSVLDEHRRASMSTSPGTSPARPSPSSTDEAVKAAPEGASSAAHPSMVQGEEVSPTTTITPGSTTTTTAAAAAAAAAANDEPSDNHPSVPTADTTPLLKNDDVELVVKESTLLPAVETVVNESVNDLVAKNNVDHEEVVIEEVSNVIVNSKDDVAKKGPVRVQEDAMHTCSLLDAEDSLEEEGEQSFVSNSVPQKSIVEETGIADQVEESAASSSSAASEAATPSESMRDQEEQMVGGEILFRRDAPATFCGWDNLRWMSYSGVRRLQFCQPVYRLVKSEKKALFWNTNEEQFIPGGLLVYGEPRVILFVRRPNDMDELRKLLDLPGIAEIEEPDNALQRFWVVESVADPVTTKLRLSPLTTITQPIPDEMTERGKSCFSMLTPVESIVLSAVRTRDNVKKGERSFADSGAFLETTGTETAISKALCSAHEQSSEIGQLEHEILWKHQLILGTLHSAVVSGNQSALEEAVATALKRSVAESTSPGEQGGRLPQRIIDSLDDNGLTALYYACHLRMPSAVQTLIKAGANANVRAESDHSTLLHICARNLDDKSLSIILSSKINEKPDVNVLTSFGRTPMYVAAVDGQLPSGERDHVALDRCLVTLKDEGGKMDSIDVCWKLAVSWRHEELAVVLGHSVFRFPLAVTDMSLSGYYRFPLHSALLTLHGYFGEAPRPSESALKTVAVLLEHGFEPNERLDLPSPCPQDFPVEYIGFTPLQMLACIAIDLEKSKELLDAEVISLRTRLLLDLAELLVSRGARLTVDPPLSSRSRKQEPEKGKQDASIQRRATLPPAIKLASLLGDESYLEAARKSWASGNSVDATRLASIISESRASAGFPDASSPGGSDEKSCAICWKVFGTIMNRRHKCRITRRYVCDDCATKRIVDKDGEHRISDGQYNLATADIVRREKSQRDAELERARRQVSSAATGAHVTSQRSQAAQVMERSNRDALFGGVLEHASSLVFGENEDQSKSSASQTVGTMTQSLHETRNALNERGQKLASLGEKSEQMVDASANFAKMAKELRKKSEGGLFW